MLKNILLTSIFIEFTPMILINGLFFVVNLGENKIHNFFLIYKYFVLRV